MTQFLELVGLRCKASILEDDQTRQWVINLQRILNNEQNTTWVNDQVSFLVLMFQIQE